MDSLQYFARLRFTAVQPIRAQHQIQDRSKLDQTLRSTTSSFRRRRSKKELLVVIFVRAWVVVFSISLVLQSKIPTFISIMQTTIPLSSHHAYESVKKSIRNTYIDTFLSINSQINLTSTRTPERVLAVHINDTLKLFDAPFIHDTDLQLLSRAKTGLDVGTWGWVPMIPLALTLPHIKREGIDARKKKASAVNQIIEQADIPNAHARRERVEDGKGKVDIVTARAVTYSETLVPRLLKRVQRKWWILLWKPFTFEEDALLQELAHDPRIATLERYTYTDWEAQRCIYWIQRA